MTDNSSSNDSIEDDSEIDSNGQTNDGNDLTLCLSGGGFRAAAYHLGVTRRLHELGILQKVNRLSCVSGGSVFGAFLMQHYPPFQNGSLNNFDWETEIETPFQKILCTKDFRTWPVLRRWGWTALFVLLTVLWSVQTVVVGLYRSWCEASSPLGRLLPTFAILLVVAICAILPRFLAIVGFLLLALLSVSAIVFDSGAIFTGIVLVAIALPSMISFRWGLLCAIVTAVFLLLEFYATKTCTNFCTPLTWILLNALGMCIFALIALANPSSSVESLRALYVEHLLDMHLDCPLDTFVPDNVPLAFCFNATDIIFGARWVAERHQCGVKYLHRVGSYRAGYGNFEGINRLETKYRWTIARAVAASSCFPPVFGPMTVGWPASVYRGTEFTGVGKTLSERETDRQKTLEAMMVNDGGNYGNLGVLAAARSNVVIVSDGGAPLGYTPPKTSWQLLGRYSNLLMAVNVNQSVSDLLQAFQDTGAKRKQGAIARIGRRVDDSNNTPDAIQKYRIAQRIAEIRTDLAPLTFFEFQATEELGYLSIDERIENFAQELWPQSTSTPQKTRNVLGDPKLEWKLAFRKTRLLAPWLRRLLAWVEIGPSRCLLF